MDSSKNAFKPSKPTKHAYHGAYKCVNCVTLENQLKEILLELSSYQFIIKLLYKELNDPTALYKPACDAIIENGVCVESAMPTTLSEFTSIYPGGKNELVNSESEHAWQPIPVSNRYSVLSCLLQSSIGEDEMAPLRSLYKKNKEPRGVKNSSVKHPPFPIFHVSRSDHGSNFKCDSQFNCILTLANGHVCFIEKDSNRQCESDKSHTQSLLKEITQKLIVNKKRFFNCQKHKVLLVGDCHLRGCTVVMKAFLNEQVEVLGYVKPGATFKSVMDTVICDIGKLTMDNFFIICRGLNYTNRNDLIYVSMI